MKRVCPVLRIHLVVSRRVRMNDRMLTVLGLG